LKRKTLANNLRATGYDAATATQALTSAGIDLKARAESLSIELFAALWKSLKNAEAASDEVAS
jgi:16S rRNA (adenine1518-N6/adenine1519-N6)-dimethyltransferase